MSLPLYSEAQEQWERADRLNHQGNYGLWYDKFCNRWSDDWKLDQEKGKWINTVTGICGDKGLIEEAVARYLDCITACGGIVRVYRTTSRFVTGLGREHPVENGFSWHHLLGTPYLPGSSVKGVVRDWADHWQKIGSERVDQLFGPEGEGIKRVGELIFFDALPVHPVRLEVEVMTPHYGPYYQGGDVPGDWHSPKPIPFLTVAAGQSFIFGLAPRRQGMDMTEVFTWLEDALGVIGAGAKTASGYGTFEPDSDSLQRLSERMEIVREREIENQAEVQPNEQEQNFTPIRKEMEEDGYTSSDTNQFMSQLTGKWLDKMEDPAIPEADRREIANLLAAWYQKNKAKDWQKPKKKNIEKVRRIKAVLSATERA